MSRDPRGRTPEMSAKIEEICELRAHGMSGKEIFEMLNHPDRVAARGFPIQPADLVELIIYQVETSIERFL